MFLKKVFTKKFVKEQFGSSGKLNLSTETKSKINQSVKNCSLNYEKPIPRGTENKVN
jgi:hypothetical protein